jgi:uncharacterized protein YbjT (DUF2867 family)
VAAPRSRIAPADSVDEVAKRIAERVGRLVLLTSPHQTPHPFFRQPNAMATLHARIERAMKDAKLALTIVRPGIFVSNAEPWWSAQIRAGDVVRWPFATAETAPVDERDVAASIADAIGKQTATRASLVVDAPGSVAGDYTSEARSLTALGVETGMARSRAVTRAAVVARSAAVRRWFRDELGKAGKTFPRARERPWTFSSRCNNLLNA